MKTQIKSKEKKELPLQEKDIAQNEDLSLKSSQEEITFQYTPSNSQQIKLGSLINKDNDLIEIEEIISTFHHHFPLASIEELSTKLKMASGDVVLTFLNLLNPNLFSPLLCKDIDDYIIIHMNGNALYKQLLKEKGPEIIRKREEFLGIE